MSEAQITYNVTSGGAEAPPTGISHPETRYVGADYQPKDKSRLRNTTAVPGADIKTKIGGSRGSDYIPNTEARRQSAIKEAKIKALAKDIEKKNARKLAEYERALAKLQSDEELTDQQRKALNEKVAKGPPMTPEKALELARERVK